MAILEIGINYELKSLLERKYYKLTDKILDPKIRARFLSGVQDYMSEIYHDKMNVISFSEFQIVCYYKKIQIADEVTPDLPLLVAFAIVEKDTYPDLVTRHLKEIASQFSKMYNIDEMMLESTKYFEPFKNQIDEIVGDLRFKIQDRFNSLFR